MSASDARRVAREVVTRVRERDAWAHETLNAVLRSNRGMDARERSLATRLAYGAIACRGTLDEAVGRFARPGGRIEPVVSDALAVAGYELLFSGTVARAAVSQGVELVREVSPRATGFANAILRRLAAAAPDFPWGDPTTDDAALARAHGQPLWLAQLLIAERGRETASEVLAANNTPAPLYLAHLPFTEPDIQVVVEELRDAGAQPEILGVDGCIVARDAAAAVASDALGEGRVLVCDMGAQLAAACVPLSEGARIVEIGAGRGTKTLLIAAAAHRMGVQVEIVASDVHEAKLSQLGDTVRRLGVPGVTTCVADGSSSSDGCLGGPGSADVVFIDAPCSGLGTLRRHPDRRWRMQPAEVASVAALGASLLRSMSDLVKPFGFMVYSTCTIAHEENEGTVSGFLETAGAGFKPTSLPCPVPSELQGWVTEQGWFGSLPTEGGPDGHFIASMQRVGDVS